MISELTHALGGNSDNRDMKDEKFLALKNSIPHNINNSHLYLLSG